MTSLRNLLILLFEFILKCLWLNIKLCLTYHLVTCKLNCVFEANKFSNFIFVKVLCKSINAAEKHFNIF